MDGFTDLSPFKLLKLGLLMQFFDFMDVATEKLKL